MDPSAPDAQQLRWRFSVIQALNSKNKCPKMQSRRGAGPTGAPAVSEKSCTGVNYNLNPGLQLTRGWSRRPAAGGTLLHSSDKQRLRTWQRGRLQRDCEDTR